ncbi:MAG: hypothetical protein R3360_07510 [Alphaproteobacteria bacterium]|nr:hypothetical protein [Alphaproteobacteria bacterium]
MAEGKTKKLKLNKLQARTLALLQELARHPETGIRDEETGEVTIAQLPHAHGDHVHIGEFVVSSRDASGFDNEAVWVALERKGLAKANYPVSITLTPEGLAYETGLLAKAQKSDH